jgi:hypothetical protein
VAFSCVTRAVHYGSILHPCWFDNRNGIWRSVQLWGSSTRSVLIPPFTLSLRSKYSSQQLASDSLQFTHIHTQSVNYHSVNFNLHVFRQEIGRWNILRWMAVTNTAISSWFVSAVPIYFSFAKLLRSLQPTPWFWHALSSWTCMPRSFSVLPLDLPASHVCHRYNGEHMTQQIHLVTQSRRARQSACWRHRFDSMGHGCVSIFVLSHESNQGNLPSSKQNHSEAQRVTMPNLSLVTVTGWYRTNRHMHCDHFLIYCASRSEL